MDFRKKTRRFFTLEKNHYLSRTLFVLKCGCRRRCAQREAD